MICTKCKAQPALYAYNVCSPCLSKRKKAHSAKMQEVADNVNELLKLLGDVTRKNGTKNLYCNFK